MLRVARARGQKRFGAPDCRVARLRFLPGARGQRGVMFCGHGERGAAIVVFVVVVYVSNSHVSETDRIGRQTISVSTPDDPLSDVPTTTSHQAGGR